MTVFNNQHQTGIDYEINLDRLRRSHYADKYFENVRQILTGCARDGKTFADFNGSSPRDLPVDPADTPIGDLVVEAQIFNRRKPRALVAGIDAALWMLRHGTGYFDDQDQFVETWQNLDVTAVYDGTWTEYDGDPMNVETVLEVRGRYRDFANLETNLLGFLTRASRIATNAHAVQSATNGKPLLFFPARFDLPSVQAIDGYGYWLAVQRYAHDSGHDMQALVSTDAQAAWWGGQGVGTVPHALIATFMADTAAAMSAFAQYISPDVPRIVLVDFNNDSVAASLDTLRLFWHNYIRAVENNDEENQKRWTLNGVRLDTAASVVDKSLQPDGEPGVNADLVRTVRGALDNAWKDWDVPARWQSRAQEYCQNVGITVSGGFTREKIARFEADNVPVTAYGVGSSLFSNESQLGTNTDYTMDVVRVQVNDQWIPIAKTGRRPCDNPNLHPVDLSIFS